MTAEEFYHPEFTEKFLDIVDEYQDQIIVMLGAHVHRMALKAPMRNRDTELADPDKDLKIIATPSISPVYENNPAYTIAEFVTDGGEIQISEVNMHNFNIFLYMVLGVARFQSYNLSTVFGGVDLNSATQIRSHVESMMLNPQKFMLYFSRVLGYDWITEKMMQLLTPYYFMFGDKTDEIGRLCLDSYYMKNNNP